VAALPIGGEGDHPNIFVRARIPARVVPRHWLWLAWRGGILVVQHLAIRSAPYQSAPSTCSWTMYVPGLAVGALAELAQCRRNFQRDMASTPSANSSKLPARVAQVTFDHSLFSSLRMEPWILAR
jgi:hypothetical protein